MSTIFDNFNGKVDFSIFKKSNTDPKTSIRRHYLSLVGLLKYVDIINGESEESELPEGITKNTVEGMVNHCIGDLDTRKAAITIGPAPDPEVPSKPEEIINTPEEQQTADNTIASALSQIAETGKAATVDIPEGEILGNIILPRELTKGVTINGPIANGATIRNDSTQYMTINNTGEAVDVIIDAKAYDTNGTVYPKGEYNNIYTDSSLSGSSST